ncbi:MAG: hypothetical protein JJE17_00100 [Peptostreptococcaceae bacterium]|nr:hypothetical protein [Peptostreptococcaceae bacterium]
MEINKEVFINCPFDENYNPMLHTIIFAVVSMGYSPRLSLESSDSSVNRINKIMDLIGQSRISIHDLSYVKSEKEGEFSRMNMPFEFGLDFGCKKYASESVLKSKKFLVLGGDKYDYMKALSDISGIDIYYHQNDQTILVKNIRHWFVINEDLDNTPTPHDIWMRLMDFNSEYTSCLNAGGYSDEEIYEIPVNERIKAMKKFIAENPYKN